MEQSGYIKPGPATMQDRDLDAVFGALADPVRRAILSRLSQGQATVTELAQPFTISQPAISRHLKVLERAGLVARKIDEQRRPAELAAANMSVAAAWLEEFRVFWGSSFDQLEGVLQTMQTPAHDDKNISIQQGGVAGAGIETAIERAIERAIEKGAEDE